MQKYAKETSVGVFVLLGLLCVGYLTIKLGNIELVDSNSYTVSAKFTSVAGLRPGAAVEIAGVPVGQVEDITLDREFGVAIVSMSVARDIILGDDVIASVKTSGLIGDKYIKLTLGGSPDELSDGDEITETESAVDLEALISKYVFGSVENQN